MGAHKALKGIAGLLLIATVFCVMVIPPYSGLSTICAVLAGIDALVLLILLGVNFRSKDVKLGKLEVLMSLALIVLLVCGALMGFMNSAEKFDVVEGDQIALSGFGLEKNEIMIEYINGRPVTNTKVLLALELENNITVHHTLSQNEPIEYHGMQINLIETQGSTVVLQVKYNPFDKILKTGGVILLIGLFLKAITAGRGKKGMMIDA